MKWHVLFLGAVVLLQLSAAVAYAVRRQWPHAVMLAGAAIANAATLFLPATPEKP